MEFKKYTKIKKLGDFENKDIFTNPDDVIVIQEKVDGANFRFHFNEEGNIIFGSRTQQLTDNNGEYTNMAKVFTSCADYIKEQVMANTTKERRIKLMDYLFYGEAMHKHTISYDWENTPRFLGFDARKVSDGEFTCTTVVKALFEELGLETVPELLVIRAGLVPEINDAIVPKTKFGNTQAEGVVFKNITRNIYAKYVRNEFKEANAKTFGGNPKYSKVDNTNNADFIFKYCTNARIEKLIHKLQDEGNNLSMKMIGPLIKRTYDDIVEEEWRDILNSNWTLSFKDIRKGIAPRIRAVLDMVMTNSVR